MNNLNIDHSSLIDRASVWLRCLVIAGALACLVFSPGARAVTPPPDGGYPNENTAEGDGALFNLTIGRSNTAAMPTSTRPRGQMPFLISPAANGIQPSVFRRFTAPQPATITQRTASKRSMATQPAPLTRQLALTRSKATRAGIPTRPPVTMR